MIPEVHIESMAADDLSKATVALHAVIDKIHECDNDLFMLFALELRVAELDPANYLKARGITGVNHAELLTGGLTALRKFVDLILQFHDVAVERDRQAQTVRENN